MEVNAINQEEGSVVAVVAEGSVVADTARADAHAADDTPTTADEQVRVVSPPVSPASIPSPSDIEVQRSFNFQVHAMNIDASLNRFKDSLMSEINTLIPPPPPSTPIPPTPAAPPNYQQLYIDSLLDQISTLKHTVATLENTINKQHAQTMLLIESTAPMECAPTSPPAASDKAAPAVKAPSTNAQSAKISGAHASGANVSAKMSSASKKTSAVQSAATTKHRVKRIEIVGDSMLGGINGWSKPGVFYTRVNSFGGATSADIVDMAEIALRREPDMLIVHSGTNDFGHGVQTKKELQRVISKARGKNPDIVIGISAICHRVDEKHLQPKIRDMNNQLKNFCQQQQVTLINHDDFDADCLARKGLHPNENGNTSIKQDFDRTIQSSFA